MMTDMTDLYEEPLLFIYQYLCEVAFLENNVSDMFSSRLALKTFIETYMMKNLDSALSLQIEKETYTIPKLESFDRFQDTFQEGILPLPSIDNPKIMGFRNNEEILGNYEISKNSFKLLSNYFYETKSEDHDGKLITKIQTNEFQALLKKNPSEISSLGLISYIEYALMIVDKYEDTIGSSTESAKIITEICDSFNYKIFEQIGQAISRMANRTVKDANTSGNRSSKSNMPSQIIKASDREQSVKSFDKQNRIHDKEIKEDSHLLNSHDLSQRKAATFKIKFSRSYLLMEYKALVEIAEWITRDLNIAKMYLCGEPIFRLKEIINPLLKSFYLNEVPDTWRERLYSKNVDLESFTTFLKSLLMKLDQLFSLTVKLKGDLPPIIPIDRLLDPESFFINLWHANSKLRNLPFHRCIFTLRSCKVRNYTETQSTIKISGLCIRGGTIDPMSGELQEESPREFSSPLHSMYLDIVETDPIEASMDLDPIHAAFVMLDQNKSNGQSIRKQFFKQMAKEIVNPTTLFADRNPDKNNPVEMNKEKKKKLQEQLTPETDNQTGKNCVRIPVYLSQSNQSHSLAKIDFYLYCYSSLPQIYWINKGTFVKLTDSNNN